MDREEQSYPVILELPLDNTTSFGQGDLENFPEVNNVKPTEGILSFCIDLQKFNSRIFKIHLNDGFKFAYDTRSNTKGLCLIINNRIFTKHEERRGTEVDGKNLLKLFSQLGYLVDVQNNKTASEMKSVCKEFILKPEHDNYTSCILAILSHGTDGWIFGSDSKAINERRDIFDHFNNSMCKLRHKPKLVIVQACRTMLQTIDRETQHSGEQLNKEDLSFQGNSEMERNLSTQEKSEMEWNLRIEGLSTQENSEMERNLRIEGLSTQENSEMERNLSTPENSEMERNLSTQENRAACSAMESHDGIKKWIRSVIPKKGREKKPLVTQELKDELLPDFGETLPTDELDYVAHNEQHSDPNLIEPRRVPELLSTFPSAPSQFNGNLDLETPIDLLALIRKTNEKDMDYVEKHIVPDFADLLIAHSTIPGYLSWRHHANGSWFVQAIVKVFSEDYTDEHVADMLVRVNQIVGEAIPSPGELRASPSPINHLRKKFYFFPPEQNAAGDF